MTCSEKKSNKSLDRIEGDTIFLFDSNRTGSRTLKKVEIFTTDGKKRTYEIKRTMAGKYLFN